MALTVALLGLAEWTGTDGLGTTQDCPLAHGGTESNSPLIIYPLAQEVTSRRPRAPIGRGHSVRNQIPP
jgi:hypothetical protein